jgi:hypothetical protein
MSATMSVRCPPPEPRRLAESGADSARSVRMTDTDRPREEESEALPPVGDAAEPDRSGPMNTIAGTDAGALGIGGTQRTDPPSADAAPSRPAPPAAFDPNEARESKPWFTSLAARSEQAGVANAPAEPVDPNLTEEEAVVREKEEDGPGAT